MLPYWSLFAFLGLGGLVGSGRPDGAKTRGGIFLILAMVLIALMIGTRFRVGADWNAYRYMFAYADFATLGRQLSLGDPGYLALNWFVRRAGGELWMVNLVCGTIFSWGLYRLAQVQPEPWLAVLVAFPYLVVVVAMGYSRQGTAIGILLAGLAHLSRRRSAWKFLIYVAAAATFHRTAIIMFPLALFGAQQSRVINVMLVAACGYFLTDLFLSSSVDRFVRNYITAQYTSQGATIRVLMSVVPALLFFVANKRMGFDEFERKIWRNFAVGAMIMLLALFIVPSSTAVDRTALYILPLQIAVFSRVTILSRAVFPARVAVILYAAAILFVWMNFADNSNSWVPYRSYLWT